MKMLVAARTDNYRTMSDIPIAIGTALVTERSPDFFRGEVEVEGMCPNTNDEGAKIFIHRFQ